MNKHEAYEACHEMMLLNPGYVPKENATVSYLLIQLADTEQSFGISGMVVNPELPEEGALSRVGDKPLDQKVALLGLPEANEAVNQVFKALDRIHGIAEKGDMEEAGKQLVALVEKIAERSR